MNMTKTTSTQKKSTTKSVSVSKKANTKVAATAKNTEAKKRVARKKQPVKSTRQRVDIYPNRMTLAISALAGTLIVLLALIAVLGQR